MRTLIAAVLAVCLPVMLVAADCEVSSYFASPACDGAIRDALIELIDQAEFEIIAAIYSFTDSAIAEALLGAHARGVHVVVLMDNKQASNSHSVDELLAEAGIDVFLDTLSYAFHHKFMVADESVVVTGSYNWSENANDRNFENIVIIRCPEVALQFKAELDYLLGHYGFAGVQAHP